MKGKLMSDDQIRGEIFEILSAELSSCHCEAGCSMIFGKGRSANRLLNLIKEMNDVHNR